MNDASEADRAKAMEWSDARADLSPNNDWGPDDVDDAYLAGLAAGRAEERAAIHAAAILQRRETPA